MAFNADEYIGVIVEQIADNFTELHKTVEACKELQEKEHKFRNSYELMKYAKLAEKINEEKTNLGEVVCNKYKSIEPLSVGLFGEWGSGKTHLLKLIESSINTIQLDDHASRDKKKTFPQTTIPVFFNAWRFEKEEHMIIPLFQTLLTAIEEYEHMTLGNEAKKFLSHGLIKLKVLGKALSKGLQVPDKLGEVPTKMKNLDATVITDVLNVEPITEEFEKKVKEELVDDELFKELTEQSRLESVYYKIPEWIEKITIADNINFVFLIDDLDRCLPENTLKMLESIKLFLDVPSCAFVLAIDDDVVERGVAYHYRDYLKKIVRVAGEDEKQSQELPITGHEYLEKMIQLPFRIPVIGTDNIYDFLDSRYRTIFERILKEDKIQKEQQSQTDMILDFFSKTIPPKPRKLKRTAMLFETKVRLLDALKIELRPKLIAKMTLLELFAPKLLRFMQNNGYVRIYDRLVYFKSLENLKSQTEEKEKLTLADVKEIKEHIDSEASPYDVKEKELYHKLMDIVTESRSSRMVFDLDFIFDTTETKENLQLNIEMMKPKEKKVKATVSKFTYLSESSLEKLFRPNDSASWADAFRDNKALVDGEALLSDRELDEVIALAKEKEEFAKDPEWMGIVATYISDEQYIHLLKELYEYRFAIITSKFKMGIYQITFAEYDRYCQCENLEKINDNEWGRGKRPIMYVSWEDATQYAKWLSGLLGVEYKLPSSDNWYLACSGGKQTRWYFGDDEKELKEYAWYSENSDGKTHPVGMLKPNEFELYDMHGNVFEWCENWYTEKEKEKVLRGGSWNYDSNLTKASFIYRLFPSNRYYYVGFRLLRTLP